MKTTIVILVALSAVMNMGADTILQEAYLKASNTGAGDYFGSAVAISGNTAVIGAVWQAARSGAAYVFVYDGNNWMQQAYLKGSNTETGDIFGQSVSISGDTIVVGAEGEDSSARSVNGNPSDNSATDSGAAYVFVRNGTSWSQQAYLKASNADPFDHFGTSVAISGDAIVVGATGENSNATGVNGNQADNSAYHAGAAYIFVRNGTNWSQQAYLKPSNTGAIDRFGSAAAISDDTVVIGAPDEDSNATGVNGNQSDNSTEDAGAAYVFVRSGTNWSQQAYLKASNTGFYDEFGNAVAVSGDTIVIGAPEENSSATGVNGNQNDESAIDSGAAYIFARNGTNWSQQAYLKASNTQQYDGFGSTVAVEGNTVIVSAYGEGSSATGVNGDQSDNSAGGSGAVYLFARSGTNWTQQAYLKASNTGRSDFFGSSVALSGGTAVIGAWSEDSSATGVNGNQDDNSVMDSGAAYIFTGFGPFVPSLFIARSATNIVLSWSTNATDFTLQSTTNLNPPILWSDFTNITYRVGDQFTATNSTSAAAQFFRLKQP
jgi:hypothetical protein